MVMKKTAMVTMVVIILFATINVYACRYDEYDEYYTYDTGEVTTGLPDLEVITQVAEDTDYYDVYNYYEYPYVSDLYMDEYQASYYTPVQLNSSANLYSYQGDYICTIPAGETVYPDESVGNSFDILYVNYNGQNGYIMTNTVTDTYPEQDSIILLSASANLRDENNNILTTIPQGYGVQIINYDSDTNRYYVIYNGMGGTIPASAIWGANEQQEVTDTIPGNGYESSTCYYGNYATIKTLIGANLRNSRYEIIIAIPYGETVEVINDTETPCGRTKVRWGQYIGTVLTSTLSFK
jgi:hypothetical protein